MTTPFLWHNGQIKPWTEATVHVSTHALHYGSSVFEGERVYGWTHVSTGSSAALPGGTVKSKIHLDGIIGAPTIYLDDELILEKGKFVAEFQA